MAERSQQPVSPGFVVLKQTAAGQWQLLGEARRKPGLTAQAARTHAIMEATGGRAKAGEIDAAGRRSEGGVAQRGGPPA